MPIKSSEVLASVPCAALGVDVLILKDAWYGHIKRHLEMDGKLPLVKEVIEKKLTSGAFVQWDDGDKKDFFSDYECPHFLPLNKFLRLAFKILDDKTVILASAYGVFDKAKRRIIKYEPSF